ncbi:beta-1,6-N-acetylglucosaminyltransferase [Mixta calida]|uniref:beta-1,6-N-acetylglucosaminyltransferase n=1 Tax=Mixta calida TaxID=665913 RepID=UPI00090052DA|nr:beta-1,6-N-acetylglucosaminyltransferase [Mixta calida]POU48006.1 hypothetical protein C3380_13355 [Pantoea sp. PSNIH5]POU66313.1 hypothetical protein C3374_12910 [Pantoea sp. PSNIH4]POY65321.1 hypothetical protein C3402_24105 [Pantoea sp. PSNIH3]MDU5770429.1 beta-1,6-N-acetylglucosaminyltransferase [Mixta calida]MDU5829012.1 beta-1,6-N-acetylglucosaminyltransferase [Mixta calida]
MDKKIAVIVLAHKNAEYISLLCKTWPEVKFYVHIDLKSEAPYIFLKELLPVLTNLHLIKNRVAVYWGGNSQVEAMNNCLREAFANEKNYYFHFISSECLPVKNFSFINQEWDKHLSNKIIIESELSPQYAWRLKRLSPHADTKFQRSFWGRVITKFVKWLPFLFTKSNIKPDEYLYGSQWFSIQRPELRILLESIGSSQIKEFEGILCSDEHFFPIMIKRANLGNRVLNNNKRYVNWGANKNSPSYLNGEQLIKIAETGNFWFARKVQQKEALAFLDKYEKS